ncbi:MAG TPA: hypothetical protein VG711_07445 [Phycisphaerales bacterium]|nr:hypothetical protein [Phycisphaerales bacterium]
MKPLGSTIVVIACCIRSADAADAAVADSVPASQSDSPTYVRDIAPIMQANCVDCHCTNGAAPFSLQTYEEVKKRALQISKVTESGFMPPWQAAEQPKGLEFFGERHLGPAPIELIAAWVKSGAIEGDAIERQDNDVRDVAASAPATQITTSQPEECAPKDIVLKLAHAIDIPAEGNDLLYSFVLPTNLDHDVWAKRVEFVPSNPRIVHHASLLADDTGIAKQLAANSPTESFLGMGSIGLNAAGSFGTWTAGGAEAELPRPLARKIKKGSDIVAEVHFGPTGKIEPFTFEVKLTLCKPGDGDANAEDAYMPVTTVTLGSYVLDIPAGERGYTVEDTFELPCNATLISLTPHAHYVAQRMRVTAILPKGGEVQLLRIDDWDFNWMREYQFVKPVALPKRTKIRMQYVYDNTADNPQNPFNPPQEIKAGHTTADEMAQLLLTVAVSDEEEVGVMEQAHRAAVGRRIAEKQKRAESRSQNPE